MTLPKAERRCRERARIRKVQEHYDVKPQPFRIWYKQSSSDKVESCIAVGVLNGKMILADGGWNPAEGSFLTERQCRLHHGLISDEYRKKALDRLIKSAKELSSARRELDRAARILSAGVD